MTTERSDKVYEIWRQATEKFDYFVLGVTGALCAYISQTYKPAKLGVNPGTLELVALVLLVIAAVAGFRRIERTNQVTILNHKLLRASEEKGALMSKSQKEPLINESTGDILYPHIIAEHIEFLSTVSPEIHQAIERAGSGVHWWYQVRNRTLLLGFAALIAAKVSSAYV